MSVASGKVVMYYPNAPWRFLCSGLSSASYGRSIQRRSWRVHQRAQTSHQAPARCPRPTTSIPGARVEYNKTASLLRLVACKQRRWYSQLGYIIFLAYGNLTCQPLSGRRTSRLVTRSVLDSETMALADAFDMEYALKHDIETIFNQNIPIEILTDILSLFDLITKAIITADNDWWLIYASSSKRTNVQEFILLG
jgi:hypothetical protein